jgi:hypothetical protein
MGLGFMNSLLYSLPSWCCILGSPVVLPVSRSDLSHCIYLEWQHNRMIISPHAHNFILAASEISEFVPRFLPSSLPARF